MLKQLLIVAMVSFAMGNSIREELNFVANKLNELFEEVVEDLYAMVDEVEYDISHIPEHVHTVFANFKDKYGKTYTGEEHNKRLGIFYDNLKIIDEWMEEEQTS